MVKEKECCKTDNIFDNVKNLVSPIRRYDDITGRGLVRSDIGQREVIKKLDDLWYHLREYKPKPYQKQGKSRTVSKPSFHSCMHGIDRK